MQSAKKKVCSEMHFKLFYKVQEFVSDLVNSQVRNVADIENIMMYGDEYGDVYMTMVEEYGEQ